MNRKKYKKQDDESIYRIHCPSKNGTVWEMKKTNIKFNKEGN